MKGAMSETNLKEQEQRRRGIYLLPNLLTTGGLFAGFYSIVASVDGNFVPSAIAIFVAMFLDGLDGRVARLTSTETDFGKEYDSLADMVSFGLAPAVVTYQWGVARLAEYGGVWAQVGWLGAFLFTVAAAFRLARFNTSIGSKDKRFFQGLPSPSAAAGVAAMVWLSTTYGIHGFIGLVAGVAITVLAGLLMVSNFRYPSFKDFNLTRRVRFATLILIPLIFVVVSLNPPVVLFCIFVIYASSGPGLWLWKRRRSQVARTKEPESK